MFRSDAQADGGRVDVLPFELLGGELRVGGGGGMYDEALHIGHVGQKRENLEIVDERPCLLLAAAYVECEDGASARGKQPGVEGVVGVCGQLGVVDPGHFGVGGEEADDAFGVVGVALHAQAECLQALQKNPCVEGRDGRSGVA